VIDITQQTIRFCGHQTDTKTDTKRVKNGIRQYPLITLDYPIKSAILTLQPRGKRVNSDPRLQPFIGVFGGKTVEFQ
jgi:hypothetical protein